MPSPTRPNVLGTGHSALFHSVLFHLRRQRSGSDAEELGGLIAGGGAGQRIRDLAIEVGTDGVVLHGRSPSYYVKQLAQQGVWELLPGVGLRNAIVVGN